MPLRLSLSLSLSLSRTLFVDVITSFFVLMSLPVSFLRSESEPFSVSDCVRERNSVCVREIINEADAWPLFEI